MDTKFRILKALRNRGLCRVKKNVDALRWGFIGLGNMAETFANVIDDSKDDVIAAVASRSISKAKAFGKRHGCDRAYGSYEDMVRDGNLQIDVVYIATPAKYHYEHIKLCLEVGRNVLCEKPITSDASQLQELQNIADYNGQFLMEGMWMKCLPTFQIATKMIADGKIGDVEFIRVDFNKRELVDASRNIFNKAEGGGVLMDYGIYAISFASEFIGGEPDDISYEVRKNGAEIDIDWNIVLKKGSVKAIVNISSDFNSLSKAVVVGSKGSIEWQSQFNRTNCIRRFDVQNKLDEEILMPYTFEGYEYEVKHVNECLRKGMKESNIVPLSSSLNAMNIIDRLRHE